MALRLLLITLVVGASVYGQETTGGRTPIAITDSSGGPGGFLHTQFSPPDSARMLPIVPRFAWPHVRGSSSYRLQVASDSLFLVLVYQDSMLTDTTRQCDAPLNNDALYYWRVGWQDLSGETTYAEIRSFVTAPAPSFSEATCVIQPTRKGGTSLARIVLRNPVGVPISVDSVMNQTRAFGIGDSLPAIVPPNDSLRLSVLFRPLSFRSYRDTLVVATSQGTARLPLAGESPPPILGVPARELLFGPISISDTGKAAIPLRNLGLFNDLSIAGISTGTPFFIPSREPLLTVGADDSVVISIRFHAKAARPERFGVYYDTMTVVSDGGTARIVLRGDTPPPKIETSSQAIDLGLVGRLDSATALLRIRNGSINILQIDSIRTTGRTFRPAFSRARVSRTDSLQLTVKFTPDKCGPFIDTLVLFNNSWTSVLRVPLKGYAPYPVLEADYERVNFGVVEKGDSGSVAIRLWNSSISFLKVDSVHSRMRQFRTGKPSLPRILRLGDAIVVRVTFFPDSARKYYDTLLIVSTSDRARHRIPLLAEGVPSWGESFRSGRSTNYELYQNYPNPFNTTTTFSYNLPVRSRVRLEVYTTLGQQIAVVLDGEQDAGVQNVPWEAHLTSGVYFYRLHATSIDDPNRQFSGSHKMILVR